MVHYYLDDVLVKQLEQNLLSASEVQCFQDAAMRLEENVYNGKRAFVADINKMVRI